MGERLGVLVAFCVLCGAGTATPAHAAFPGSNGKIAFVRDGQIWSMNADGTGQTQLTPGAAGKRDPEWSPAGTKIAYWVESPGLPHVRVMNADGTGDAQLIPARSTSPSWSPDGKQLAYVAQHTDSNCGCTVHELVVADADGTNGQVIARGDFQDSSNEYGPINNVEWSPDGQDIIFSDGFPDLTIVYRVSAQGGPKTELGPGDGASINVYGAAWLPGGGRLGLIINDYRGSAGEELYTMNRDGTGQAKVNGVTPLSFEWSPDGKKLVVSERGVGNGDLYSANSDGTLKTPLTVGPQVDTSPDWQPIPINAYPRPLAAAPVQVTMALAYEPCTSPNRTHGPPLEEPSCAPPVKSSSQLTVGTFDANGQLPGGTAQVIANPIVGDPSTATDEADVYLRAKATDVRLAADLSDYSGSLEARMLLRITDKDNSPSPGGPGAATVADISYSFSAPCSPTPDTGVGSSCFVETTVDSLVPGTVREKRRTVWEVGQVALHDGAGNAFMRQGIFVP